MKKLSILLLVLFPILINAQGFIKGKIYDSKNNTPLSFANIQVQNKNLGTISNEKGEFLLQYNSYPNVILVSYIGYNTFEIILDKKPSKPLKIPLKRSQILLEEIIIDSEDPGMKIMRKVIARKEVWKQDLSTFKADVYCRTTLYGDTSVALVKENMNTAYWDKDKESREIIHTMNQSS